MNKTSSETQGQTERTRRKSERVGKNSTKKSSCFPSLFFFLQSSPDRFDFFLVRTIYPWVLDDGTKYAFTLISIHLKYQNWKRNTALLTSKRSTQQIKQQTAQQPCCAHFPFANRCPCICNIPLTELWRYCSVFLQFNSLFCKLRGGVIDGKSPFRNTPAYSTKRVTMVNKAHLKIIKDGNVPPLRHITLL